MPPGHAPDPPFPRRLAPILALTVSPLLTYLLLSRPWLAMPATAGTVLALLSVRAPAVASVCLVPFAYLGAAQSGGPTMAFGGVAVVAGAAALRAVAVVVAAAVALRCVAGVSVARGPHAWIGLLTVLLLTSFYLPPVTLGAPSSRFVDLVGLLAGLALLAAVTAAPPAPGAVARVTALAGTAAAAFVLAVADHDTGRLHGLGLNPNYLGAMLVLPLVAAVGLARLAPLARRPLWLAPVAICLTGMVATESRGAFLAAAVGVTVVLVHGRGVGVQALIVAAVTVVGTALPGGTGAAEHVAAGGRSAVELSSNTAVREQAAWFAVHVAADHPLRGIGYGMFPPYAEGSERLGLYIATHNDYLRLAAEAGAITLAVFLALLWFGVRGRRHGDLALLRAIVLAYAAGLFFANQLANLVISMPFWLSLGCLLAAAPDRRRIASQRDKEGSTDDRQSGRDQRRRALRVRQ